MSPVLDESCYNLKPLIYISLSPDLSILCSLDICEIERAFHQIPFNRFPLSILFFLDSCVRRSLLIISPHLRS
jgi:hypothetical protein